MLICKVYITCYMKESHLQLHCSQKSDMVLFTTRSMGFSHLALFHSFALQRVYKEYLAQKMF